MAKRSVQAYIEEVPSWDGGARLSGPPLSAMQWLVWSLATAGKFFEGLIVFMGGIALPLIAEQFSMTGSDKGLVTAATLAGILAGALALGGLADRFGRKPVFIGEMVLLAVALLVAAFSPNTATRVGALEKPTPSQGMEERRWAADRFAWPAIAGQLQSAYGEVLR